MPYLPFVYSLILGHPSNRQLTSSLTTFLHLYGCLSCSVSISPYHATTNIQYRLGLVDAFQPTNALQYIFLDISAFFHANIQYHRGPHSKEAVLDTVAHPLLSLTKAVTQLPMLNWFQWMSITFLIARMHLIHILLLPEILSHLALPRIPTHMTWWEFMTHLHPTCITVIHLTLDPYSLHLQYILYQSSSISNVSQLSPQSTPFNSQMPFNISFRTSHWRPFTILIAYTITSTNSCDRSK